MFTYGCLGGTLSIAQERSFLARIISDAITDHNGDINKVLNVNPLPEYPEYSLKIESVSRFSNGIHVHLKSTK